MTEVLKLNLYNYFQNYIIIGSVTICPNQINGFKFTSKNHDLTTKLYWKNLAAIIWALKIVEIAYIARVTQI